MAQEVASVAGAARPAGGRDGAEPDDVLTMSALPGSGLVAPRATVTNGRLPAPPGKS